MENKNEIIGNFHSIETFGLVDGPGVRYILFLQGCNLRCKYCHNPETWKCNVGKTVSPKEAFEKAYRYKTYWRDNGGITVSGGEPLLQINFVIEFFKYAKEKNIHTTIDTAGNPFTKEEPFFSKFKQLMELTDLFMLDMKEMDDKKHIELTGKTNKNIIEMADYLSEQNKEMWIRHVLVPGLTDQEDGLIELRKKIDSWKNVSKVEILPYHTLGLFKWENMGIDYPLDGVRTPSEEEIKKAEKILLG